MSFIFFSVLLLCLSLIVSNASPAGGRITEELKTVNHQRSILLEALNGLEEMRNELLEAITATSSEMRRQNSRIEAIGDGFDQISKAVANLTAWVAEQNRRSQQISDVLQRNTAAIGLIDAHIKEQTTTQEITNSLTLIQNAISSGSIAELLSW